MKKIFHVIIVLAICSCNGSKLFTEYKLYRRDKYFDYPKEKLTIKILNDSAGLFVNTHKGRESFSQEFTFSKIENDYLSLLWENDNLKERPAFVY